MSSLADNFADVHQRIIAACEAVGREPGEVELVAVSKFHPPDAVRAAVAVGQIAFGESRVQELVQKVAELPREPALRWHLIGSLQTNKVRDLVQLPAPGLALLHSLDRAKLANELHRWLEPAGRQLEVLLQVNASGEDQKHGCAIADTANLLEHVQTNCTTLRVSGLMAMGPLSGDARPVFDQVAELRDRLRKQSELPLDTLSLGMSGDLEAAIAAGSTMVRVGTALFGPRP